MNGKPKKKYSNFLDRSLLDLAFIRNPFGTLWGPFWKVWLSKSVTLSFFTGDGHVSMPTSPTAGLR